MKLIDIYKNSLTYRIINEDLNNNMKNHAYLLIGADEYLLSKFIVFVASQIMCEKNNIAPCLNCLQCNKIEHNNHPDVLFYPVNGNRLSVEEARKIVNETYTLPYEGNKKIFIINNFDLATTQSQNALLKTIEECLPKNTFILSATNSGNVVTTIKSRCKKINVSNLNDEELLSILKETYKGNENINMAVTYACGNLTEALNFLNDKNSIKIFNLCLNTLSNLSNSTQILEYSSKLLIYKDCVEEILNTFIVILRNIATKRLGYEKFFQQYSLKVINGITKRIIDLCERYKANVSAVEIIDKLLFDILEVKYLCKSK